MDISKGPNGDTKYTIMISVKKIDDLSVNRAGEVNFAPGQELHEKSIIS